MEKRKEKILFSEKTINSRVQELAKELTIDYKDSDLVVISLLRGSFIFAADLVRAMKIPMEIDFMTTASYGHEESSTGDVKILQDIRADIQGRDVLIVDDIIDSGYTMEKIRNHLNKKNPKSLKTVVLLDKPSRRQVDLEAEYVGFEIPDVFIVGCGLNYKNHCRNIPYIYTYDD
ncbi:MAG: hypoxanthine phosphoribosyltransferase [Tissierellia bacterium]|nr:hypoxanthine phosphoribosyltransferase [Tissierellia bacterium]